MTADQPTTVQPPSAVPPTASDLLSDVMAGLSSDPRTLPCKYFYDERGAALFQKICELPEYYITRTEIDILSRHRAATFAAPIAISFSRKNAGSLQGSDSHAIHNEPVRRDR